MPTRSLTIPLILTASFALASAAEDNNLDCGPGNLAILQAATTFLFS